MHLSVFCYIILWWLFLLFDAGQLTSFFSSSFEGTGLLIFMVVGWYLALRQVVNFHKEIILPSSTPSRSVERLSCEVSYLPPYADEELEVSGLVGQLPFRVPMTHSGA